MIPVEVTQAPWHYTTFWDWLDHWQTLIAGFLAFVAGIGTVVAAIWAVWVTRSTAKKQMAAAREEAKRVIDATREQTATTVQLERERVANEDRAFRAMLKATTDRVLAEVAWARKTYPELTTQASGGPTRDVFVVRTCITKGGFTELRAACVRLGSPLTGEFLDLEREIDSFASQWEETFQNLGGQPLPVQIRVGKTPGLVEQLTSIEAKATALGENAFERHSGSIAAPEPFETAEAEALIGAPAPPFSPAPRRSWVRYWFGWRAAG